MKLGKSDRSPETQAKYQKAIDEGTLLGLANEPPLIQYDNWKIILNAFGADAKWEPSMMYVNSNDHSWEEVTKEEAWELHCLKVKYFRKAFAEIKDNGESTSSVRDIAHGHLYKGLKVTKEKYNE